MPETKKDGELKEVKEKLKEKEEDLKEQKKITRRVREVAKTAALSLRNETRKQTVTAVVAAFGFLIALSWRDAIKGYVDHLILEVSFQGPSFLTTLYATLITTLLAVIGIIIVTRWSVKHNKEDLKDLKILH